MLGRSGRHPCSFGLLAEQNEEVQSCADETDDGVGDEGDCRWFAVSSVGAESDEEYRRGRRERDRGELQCEVRASLARPGERTAERGERVLRVWRLRVAARTPQM